MIRRSEWPLAAVVTALTVVIVLLLMFVEYSKFQQGAGLFFLISPVQGVRLMILTGVVGAAGFLWFFFRDLAKGPGKEPDEPESS